MSRIAWVGCSCVPSPALIMIASINSVRCFGAPGVGWRITTASIFMASRFWAVSLKLSPFFRLLEEAVKFTVSALSRFCASSKLIRVRVEFSKNRFTMVTPWRDGTFLMGRSRTSRKLKAVSIMTWISSLGYPSSPSRCFCCSIPIPLP